MDYCISTVKTKNTQKLISSCKNVKRHVRMILDEKWNEKSAPPPILHINVDLLILMPSVSQGNKYRAKHDCKSNLLAHLCLW